MRSIYIIMCALVSPQICVPKQAQPISYEGTLTTLNEHTYPITDIVIAKRQCFTAYKAPCNIDLIITKLAYNPKCWKKIIRLADIKEIVAPYPYTKWRYRNHFYRGTDSYLLIKIIWNDTEQAPENFLIPSKRKLSGTLQANNQTSPKRIPFSAFKKCTISTTPR